MMFQMVWTVFPDHLDYETYYARLPFLSFMQKRRTCSNLEIMTTQAPTRRTATATATTAATTMSLLDRDARGKNSHIL
jgi:hypothetical protein